MFTLARGLLVTAALLALVGLLGPLVTNTGVYSPLLLVLGLVALAGALLGNLAATLALLPLGLLGALLPLLALRPLEEPGGWGYWVTFWGFMLLALLATGRATFPPASENSLVKRLYRMIPPAAVPFLFLLAWEGLVVGFHVPKAIFPRVSDVWLTLLSSWPVLLHDSYVTFVKEVLFGLLLGLAAGFLVAVAVAFSTFLRRGFLPLAAAFGAVPIVGLAPVLGRAFGVDWQSKAAVVVLVTFFPVVLNVVQGLASVEPLELELLRAYAAKPRDIFFKLRLPNALPYLFNALKLASVIAIISVIVAEFLIPGPPNGLGQRISLAAHRGSFDVVFAAIFVSSLISMLLYGFISLLERLFTRWHASFREEVS